MLSSASYICKMYFYRIGLSVVLHPQRLMMWKLLLLFFFFPDANSVRTPDALFAASDITIYTTVQGAPGFVSSKSNFGGTKTASALLATINSTEKYQKIIGFGGTFTDAGGININKLPANVKKELLEALFSSKGIGINLCRVPIGVTEFSLRQYTLDDHDGDTALKQFALQKEDLQDKVKYINYNNGHVILPLNYRYQ